MLDDQFGERIGVERGDDEPAAVGEHGLGELGPRVPLPGEPLVLLGHPVGEHRSPLFFVVDGHSAKAGSRGVGGGTVTAAHSAADAISRA